MRLVDLKPRLSLEFSPDEWAVVGRRLKKLGRVVREEFATADVLRLAGQEFVLTSDWDECALISQSEAGDAVLRVVFAAQRARTPARDHRVLARKVRLPIDAIERFNRKAA